MIKEEKEFREYLKHLHQYNHVLSVLHWDLSTLTPKKGVNTRVGAINFFSTEAFRLRTSKEYGRMLKDLSKTEIFESLDPAMKVTVRRYLRDYERFLRVPEDFFSAFTEEKARAEVVWEEAKKKSDFSIFAPHLNEVINMTKKYVKYMEPDKDPYDVLLDMYEEGAKKETIDTVFRDISEGLKPLLAHVNASPTPDLSKLKGIYDIDQQKKVQKLLLDYIGFDFEKGACAESEHPFTLDLAPGEDIRITNHFYEDTPIPAMFSTIHESGHAIFAQNIAPELKDTAAGEVPMMGLHESQSRFYENFLGRRASFWEPIWNDVARVLPALKSVPFDTFCRAINYIHPSMIRIEADEVTYALHIILRYEMEKLIFENDIAVEKLPGIWNHKMEEFLGIRPTNDAEGILQDVHWSNGQLGYFPSYLLGSVYGSLFLKALEKEMGALDEILKAGRIKEITTWLNKNIHQYGSLYNSSEVLGRVTGENLSAKPLIDYFDNKYSKVYGFTL